MGKTGSTKKMDSTASNEELQRKLVLTGADIMTIGEVAETIVGGKNYNTAHIHEIPGVSTPQFRAVSSLCFHKLLDETTVNAALVRSLVEREYARIDWNDPEINRDSEFLQKLVRNLGKEIRSATEEQKEATRIRLRTFVNNVVEGFATSQEGIDQLRKRSVLVQAAILSVPMPADVNEAVRQAYRDICAEAGEADVPVAVRSSAAGEDSRKKAFAGLQDTYLNMVGEDNVVLAYHWDCASAYNLRSMTYRREAIRDGITRAEAMTTINRVLGRLPETADDLLDDMIAWPDNPPDAWYYLAVQEATNSHDYGRKADTVHETWTGLQPVEDWTRYEQ